MTDHGDEGSNQATPTPATSPGGEVKWTATAVDLADR